MLTLILIFVGVALGLRKFLRQKVFDIILTSSLVSKILLMNQKLTHFTPVRRFVTCIQIPIFIGEINSKIKIISLL